MLTILQGSDLHFGKPHLPGVARSFIEAVHEVAPDVITLVGDFTQRAKVSEYRQVRDLLATLPDVPVVVTPGNHDVPLYRIHERLLSPYRNYRRYVSSKLDTVTRVTGAVFVALHSSSPRRRIVNGTITRGQLDLLARIFQEAPEEEVRILVTHHPLAPPPDGGEDRLLPGNDWILDRLRDTRVDLVLGGHLHRSFSTCSSSVQVGHRGNGDIPIVHCGTATSSRGRMAEKGRNSFNVLKVAAGEIEVITHWFEEGSDRFVARASGMIPRSAVRHV
jgi:3',5'-cyclic AMP phosphodiesterase CpdA